MCAYQPHYIQRCPHDKENPYAQTSRALIRDPNIPPSVCWMLIYLLSMKDGWKISPKQIINHVKGHRGCGRDCVYTWIKIACELGYMKKEVRYENNLTRYYYLVSEYPKFKKSFSHPENQDSAKGDSEKGEDKKEHNTKKEHRKESSLKGAKESAPKPKPPDRISRAAHVSTSFKEHENLVTDFGEETTQRAYERLSEWKDDTPKSKWKKNDHLAIRRWVIDALKEQDRKAEKASKSPQNAIKQVQGYISSHDKKDVLKRAVNANFINIEKDHIAILGSHSKSGVLSYSEPGAKHQIDNLIQKLEFRLRRGYTHK